VLTFYTAYSKNQGNHYDFLNYLIKNYLKHSRLTLKIINGVSISTFDKFSSIKTITILNKNDFDETKFTN